MKGPRTQHIAVLRRPYLDRALAGTKTIECRLARIKAPPFGRVRPGDVVWLKQTSGPVRGVARAADVRCFEHVTEERLEAIRTTYGAAIGAPASFWVHNGEQLRCTLVFLADVRPVEPFTLPKRDQRAWVVLPGDASQPMPPCDRTIMRVLGDHRSNPHSPND